MPMKPEPIKVTENSHGREGETRYEHPAFGMVQFNRVHNSNTQRLYGSELEDHRTTVRLRIGRGYMMHHLGRDWYHGSSGLDLVEVELSAAQFAELLTTMNVSSGVPCTIRQANGEHVSDIPPDATTETQRTQNAFTKRMQGLRAKLKPRADEILKVISKLGAKAKREAEINLEVILQEIDKNIPFVLESIVESTTKVVSAAKHEVEAFMMHRITTAGIAALQGARGAIDALPGIDERSQKRLQASGTFACIVHGEVPAKEVYEAEGGGYGHADCWKHVDYKH